LPRPARSGVAPILKVARKGVFCMEIVIRQGRYPGEWNIEFSTDNWEPPAKDMLVGMESHFAELYESLWPWFNFEPNLRGAIGPDLSPLNEMLERVQKRIDAGNPITEYDPDKITGGDVSSLLGELLETSNWWGSITIDCLSGCEYGKAIRAFDNSVSCLVRFQTLTYVIEEIEHLSPNGPEHALAHRLDQILKPEFIGFCKSVVESGAAENVRQLNDLLDIDGYNPSVLKITPRTLKSWVNSGGIYFKAGLYRPERWLTPVRRHGGHVSLPQMSS